eukprot:5908427-Amphidinium_carterae.2
MGIQEKLTGPTRCICGRACTIEDCPYIVADVEGPKAMRVSKAKAPSAKVAKLAELQTFTGLQKYSTLVEATAVDEKRPLTEQQLTQRPQRRALPRP